MRTGLVIALLWALVIPCPAQQAEKISVAGNVLTRVTRVWPGPSGAGALGASGEVRGFCIQFREDDDNPRVVSFCYEAGGVRVGEEKREATNGR